MDFIVEQNKKLSVREVKHNLYRIRGQIVSLNLPVEQEKCMLKAHHELHKLLVYAEEDGEIK